MGGVYLLCLLYRSSRLASIHRCKCDGCVTPFKHDEDVLKRGWKHRLTPDNALAASSVEACTIDWCQME